MKKEMNNKGFSLVELIIVIAIMAVLIGVLAPQYLKYVNNSKVSTDITNAQELATAFSIAIADQPTVMLASTDDGATTHTGTGGSAISNENVKKALGIDAWPQTKLSPNQTWTVSVSKRGVSQIKLGSDVIYPNPEQSGGFYAKNHQ